MGAAVRVVSAGSVRAYLRLGAIRANLEDTTLTTPLVSIGVRLGRRYGLAASIDYGRAKQVTTVASMAGLYARF